MLPECSRGERSEPRDDCAERSEAHIICGGERSEPPLPPRPRAQRAAAHRAPSGARRTTAAAASVASRRTHPPPRRGGGQGGGALIERCSRFPCKLFGAEARAAREVKRQSRMQSIRSWCVSYEKTLNSSSGRGGE